MESGMRPNKVEYKTKYKSKIIKYCKCKLTMKSDMGPNKNKNKHRSHLMVYLW